MAQRLLGVTAALFISGCTLLVDTSNLATESPSSAASDGGVTTHGDGGVVLHPVDAGGVPVAAKCPANAFICDDFESGLGKWTTHVSNQGAVELVTDQAHSPSHAFRSTSRQTGAAVDNMGEIRIPIAPPLKTGAMLAFHAWVYFPATLFPETTIAKVRAQTGTDDMNLKIDTQGRFKVDADVPNEGPELSASEVAALNHWTCVDWQATIGSPGHQTLVVDGRKIIDTADVNATVPGYGAIGIGFVAGSPDATQVVYLDDVIVADAPVGGCP